MENISLDIPTAAQASQGRWLVGARAVWFLLFGLALGLFIASLPFLFADAHHICASTACSDGSSLSTDQARQLQKLGLTLDFYATLTVIQSIGFECVYNLIGLVTFWRRSNDRMALIASLALISQEGKE